MKKVFYIIILFILISGCGGTFPKVWSPVYDTGRIRKEAVTYFVVSVERANLRSGPGTEFNIVGHGNEGDKYIVSELNKPSGEDYYWYKIKTYNAGEIWVSGSVGYIEGGLGEAENVFDALPEQVWSPTLAGLRWMKWDTVFIDEETRNIRLKEAYVYKKFGKMFRIYNWPPVTKTDAASIDEYLEKVARYDNDASGFDRTVFSQENMQVRLFKLSQSQTKIDIDYVIKPYLESGKFGERIRSSGYIESLLLEKIRENFGNADLTRSTYPPN